jgi:CheY-like chemotaxis protein
MNPIICLLIDDDSEESEIFQYALEEMDITVKCVTAKGGKEALSYLNSNAPAPDFIFLDLNMPKMNGKECLEAIRTIPKLDEVPTILYSNSFTIEQQQELTDMGASGFITKTCSVFDLYHKLANFFKSDKTPEKLSVA